MRTALLSASYLMLATTVLAIGCSKDDDGPGNGSGKEPTEKTYMADWQTGYLDIHHIATDRGDATFVIAPDGTTLLIDAGDVGNGWGSSGGPVFPDDSKTPGEWIAAYIDHFTQKLSDPSTLDYVWITHFHGDHMGTGASSSGKSAAGYRLSGITTVGEHVKIRKIVDRAWPTYDIPSEKAVMEKANGDFMADYIAFVKYLNGKGTAVERFAAGSNTQFVLTHDATAYPTFSVRNLCVNGEVWTGTGTDSEKKYTDLSKFDENALSGAVKMSYGPFAYFAGGDLGGGTDFTQYPSPERDMETPVGKVCGKVNVLKANHHGCGDTTNASFLRDLQPAAVIILSSHVLHPYGSTLARVIDPLAWRADVDLYITSNLSQKKLGSQFNRFKPFGHVVVRVYENGAKYRIFVLDPFAENYPVKYESDEITVRTN